MAGPVERKQSLQEEFANSVTHGVGILFSVVAISLLVTFSVLKGSAVHVFACSMFGASILLLYTFSTLYHAIQSPTVKPLLRTFDHISIYFLIAGTYTISSNCLGWDVGLDLFWDNLGIDRSGGGIQNFLYP
nr:hemolysin III family protein [Litoribacter populi]